MKITGFMHIAQMGNWKEVVEEQIALANRSGLADRCSHIFLCILGEEDVSLVPPFKVLYQSPELAFYEYETLRMIWEHSKRDDGLVWYVHTKGVSKTEEEWEKNKSLYQEVLQVDSLEILRRHEKEWRHYMQHFVIRQHGRCIESLTDHDVVGASWREDPFPHFSGNFWWARSSYLKGLTDPYKYRGQYDWVDDKRAGAEAWVGSRSPRARCLCDLRHNFYRWGVPMKDYLPIHL